MAGWTNSELSNDCGCCLDRRWSSKKVKYFLQLKSQNSLRLFSIASSRTADRSKFIIAEISVMLQSAAKVDTKTSRCCSLNWLLVSNDSDTIADIHGKRVSAKIEPLRISSDGSTSKPHVALDWSCVRTKWGGAALYMKPTRYYIITLLIFWQPYHMCMYVWNQGLRSISYRKYSDVLCLPVETSKTLHLARREGARPHSHEETDFLLFVHLRPFPFICFLLWPSIVFIFVMFWNESYSSIVSPPCHRCESDFLDKVKYE